MKGGGDICPWYSSTVWVLAINTDRIYGESRPQSSLSLNYYVSQKLQGTGKLVYLILRIMMMITDLASGQLVES